MSINHLKNDIFNAFDDLAISGKQQLLVVDHLPTPLEFFRMVHMKQPVLFKNTIKWDAITKWTLEYLNDILGKQEVTVASTPNGYADAVYDGIFVQPLERKMPFQHFTDWIKKKKSSRVNEASSSGNMGNVNKKGSVLDEQEGILYAQLQNNCMTTEYKELLKDVPADIEFATTAFGSQPDAVNFWLGEDSSVTSLHKDPYENLYVVIAGKKIFTLYPPTDFVYLHEKMYPQGRFAKQEDGEWEIIMEKGSIPWISADPLQTNMESCPLLNQANAMRVEVEAGDMLYLPSLYYHHVQQQSDEEGKVVAVNYWYDMFFCHSYHYFTLAQNIYHIVKAEDDKGR